MQYIVVLSWNLFTWYSVSALDCDDYGPVDFNSRLTGSASRKPGATISYLCNPGWKRKLGDESRRCLHNGQWSGTPLQCERIMCNDYGQMDPNSHVVESTDSLFESSIHVRCDEGFETSGGHEIRICRENGTWSQQPLQCKRKKCSNYGPVDFNAQEIGTSSRLFENTITYKCKTGWRKTTGNGTRTCLSDGNWTGQPLVCEKVKCESYGQIDSNAIRTYFINNLYGSIVRFKCKKSYTRDKGDGTRYCLADGKWSGHPLTCKAEKRIRTDLYTKFAEKSFSEPKTRNNAILKCKRIKKELVLLRHKYELSDLFAVLKARRAFRRYFWILNKTKSGSCLKVRFRGTTAANYRDPRIVKAVSCVYDSAFVLCL